MEFAPLLALWLGVSAGGGVMCGTLCFCLAERSIRYVRSEATEPADEEAARPVERREGRRFTVVVKS